jgi:trehalose-6-phosphate synthase
MPDYAQRPPKGMLGANLIGFQTDEYCHRFLQTCSRMLKVEATKDGSTSNIDLPMLTLSLLV